MALGLLALGGLLRIVLLWAPGFWFDETANGVIALTVLRGELPVYLYGQPFLGVLDAYLAAPLHEVLGPSVLTLKLLPLALTLTWLALIAGVAWTAFGPRAAAFAAALLAAPPNFLLRWTIEARTKYQLCVTLGTLLLLLAARFPGRSPRRSLAHAAVLGLVLGLAFWTNFLSVVFVPAAVILALRGGLRPALLGVGPAALAFGLGSLPHWLYGLPHGTAIPGAGGWIGWAAVAEHVGTFGRVAWPILAGVPEPLQERAGGTALAVLLAAAVVLALAAAVRAAWAPGGRRAAVLALLAFVLTDVGLVVGTQHGDRIDADPKYFLPLYAALPPLVGAGLAALPPVGWAPLLAALVSVQAAGAVEGEWQRLLPDARAELAAARQAARDTVAAIERRGPDRLYRENPGGSDLVYLSGERVIVSNPYEEGYPPYARAVDGAPRVGWWFAQRDETFEANLAALGIGSTYRAFPPLGGAYADFTLAPERLRELDPRTLRATAGPNPDAAANVLDRDARTVWASGGPKRGGEWLQVDLGRVEPIALVRWLPRVFQEVPSGVRLEASLDGVGWRRLLELPQAYGPFYWSAGRPMLRVRSGRNELRVPPTPARHLRITQTGAGGAWQWSVAELFLYAADPAAPPTPPDADGATLARAVRAAGVRRLYADHGWSFRLAAADPALRVPPANLQLDAYAFTGPDSELSPVVRWEPGSGALVAPPDAAGFVRTAEASGLGVQRREAGGMALFAYAPPPALPGRALPPAELRVSVSVGGRRAPRAADGSVRTRWTTGRTRRAGDWLRVDLPAPRRVRALRVWTTAPEELPRALRLEASADGETWRALAASVRTEHRVRWAGITWLREGATGVRLEVEPTVARALRLVVAEDDPDHAWTVHELTVYAE